MGSGEELLCKNKLYSLLCHVNPFDLQNSPTSAQCKVVCKGKVYVSPLFMCKEHVTSEKVDDPLKQYVIVVVFNSRGQAECIYSQA